MQRLRNPTGADLSIAAYPSSASGELLLTSIGVPIACDRTTENNRRARYYRLTAAGGRALSEETRGWREYIAAVEAVLGST